MSRLRIGCSGWACSDWPGRFYPPEAKAKDRLAAAGRLVRMGVDPTAISIVACGEFRPAVATGDGVEEPLHNLAWVDWGSAPRPAQPAQPPCRTVAFQPGKGASAAP